MLNGEKIEEYIKECFELYGLDYQRYFGFFNEDGVCEEIPLDEINDRFGPSIVEYAAEILGVSSKDILRMSEKAMMKWLRKYKYFGLVGPLEEAYKRSFMSAGYDNVHLMEVIFDVDLHGLYPGRFKRKAIIKRLEDQLIEMDKHYPGVFHKGAEMMNLKISTNNFCSFEEIKPMVESYISMIHKAKELFVKAVSIDLSPEEINEYNFLVSALGLRDCYMPSVYLYYSTLKNCRDVYQDVTENTFYEYALFNSNRFFTPWICREFANDRELVQRYMLEVPESKAKMREYAMQALQFECFFNWSDAPPIMGTPEEEAMDEYFDKLMGFDPIPLEKRAKEPTFVYVPKTEDELAGDEITAQALTEYCRPVKLGGLATGSQRQKNEPLDRIESMGGRYNNINYFSTLEKRLNSIGGGTDE